MRPIEEKMARQRAVMEGAERWLLDRGYYRLSLENACFPHRMAVVDRCVQVRRWIREKHLLLYGHIWRRTPHRFRRPR